MVASHMAFLACGCCFDAVVVVVVAVAAADCKQQCHFGPNLAINWLLNYVLVLRTSTIT